MSIPKYLRMDRPESVKAVIVDAEDFIGYVFKVTSNEKQFPKAYRYTLIAQIRNTCLKLWRNLMDLKALLAISATIATPTNFTHMAEVYETLVVSFNHWVKNTKRSYRKALQKEDWEKSERRYHKKLEKQKFRAELNLTEDGFARFEPEPGSPFPPPPRSMADAMREESRRAVLDAPEYYAKKNFEALAFRKVRHRPGERKRTAMERMHAALSALEE